jgi:uncharacterized protein involved in type VI secretion and phage assembly
MPMSLSSATLLAALRGFTHADRPLTLHLGAGATLQEALLAVRLTSREALSELHAFDIYLHTPDAAVSPDDLPGCNVGVEMNTASAGARWFNGYGEPLFDDTTREPKAKLERTWQKETQPELDRSSAQRRPIGEARRGFRIRTDLAGALCAAQGPLISADARANATGNMLDRQELLGPLDTAQVPSTSRTGFSVFFQGWHELIATAGKPRCKRNRTASTKAAISRRYFS